MFTSRVAPRRAMRAPRQFALTPRQGNSPRADHRRRDFAFPGLAVRRITIHRTRPRPSRDRQSLPIRHPPARRRHRRASGRIARARWSLGPRRRRVMRPTPRVGTACAGAAGPHRCRRPGDGAHAVARASHRLRERPLAPPAPAARWGVSHARASPAVRRSAGDDSRQQQQRQCLQYPWPVVGRRGGRACSETRDSPARARRPVVRRRATPNRRSSAGRAPGLEPGGRTFESCRRCVLTRGSRPVPTRSCVPSRHPSRDGASRASSRRRRPGRAVYPAQSRSLSPLMTTLHLRRAQRPASLD